MGGTLLPLLYGYDSPPERDTRQSVAFSGCIGPLLDVVSWLPARVYLSRGNLNQAVARIPGYVPFIVWLAFGLVTFVIDRNRLQKIANNPGQNQASSE